MDIRETLQEGFICSEDEARELFERLELGDNESVWAWFNYRFPKTMRRVERAGERGEFVAAMREAWELDRLTPIEDNDARPLP